MIFPAHWAREEGWLSAPRGWWSGTEETGEKAHQAHQLSSRPLPKASQAFLICKRRIVRLIVSVVTLIRSKELFIPKVNSAEFEKPWSIYRTILISGKRLRPRAVAVAELKPDLFLLLILLFHFIVIVSVLCSKCVIAISVWNRNLKSCLKILIPKRTLMKQPPQRSELSSLQKCYKCWHSTLIFVSSPLSDPHNYLFCTIVS